MNSAATADSGTPTKKKPARKGVSQNRTLHRIGAFIAALLMLWMGGTGSTIQVLDLTAIAEHTPPTAPISLSIAEGMYGPANYAVMQVADFNATALPAGFDVNHGFDTVLRAARAANDNGAQSDPLAWIELRVENGAPIGQAMLGSHLSAFDAQTGQETTAVPFVSIPQGGRLPHSLRQKIKTLHRFWNRGDTPGVYVEFLTGLILLFLLITGVIMYFQLLSARAGIGRRQLFWLTGGLWRGLHRVVSVLAAIFILCVAFSGTWIGFESSWSALHRPSGPPIIAAGQARRQTGVGGAGGPGGPGGLGGRDSVTPLNDSDVRTMAATTLESMQRLHANTPIKAIRLRTFGRMKQGVVITGGNTTDQFVFNAETGEPASLTEPSYPASNFPFGVQVHENIKHFHSGAMFGVPARLMNLLAGLSLIFLAVSGLVMYFDMWFKRRHSGRHNLFWQ